jgi:hypothetical protein
MDKEVSGSCRLIFSAGLGLFSLFTIHFQNLSKIYFVLADRLHISPSELDRLEFYFIEYLLEHLEEKLEAEEKSHKKQEKEMAAQQEMSNPSIPNMSMPNLTMPNITMPSL